MFPRPRPAGLDELCRLSLALQDWYGLGMNETRSAVLPTLRERVNNFIWKNNATSTTCLLRYCPRAFLSPFSSERIDTAELCVVWASAFQKFGIGIMFR